MSLKTQLDASADALESLLAYANEATSAGDTDIGEAIRTLVDGFGKGGGSGVNTVFLGELANNANYGELMTALPPIRAKWKKSYFCIYACDGERSTGIQYRWNGLWLVHDGTTVLYGQQSYISNNLPIFSFEYGFISMIQGRVPAMQNMTETSKFVFTDDGVLDTSLIGTTSSSRFAKGDKLYLVEYRMDNSDEY